MRYLSKVTVGGKDRWRVVYPVPTTVRAIVGDKLTKMLEARDLQAAMAEAIPVIENFKTQMQHAEGDQPFRIVIDMDVAVVGIDKWTSDLAAALSAHGAVVTYTRIRKSIS